MNKWLFSVRVALVPLFICCCMSSCLASNILFITLYGSPSHVYNILPTMEALDGKGHNVTYLTFLAPPLANNSNIRVLVLNDVKKLIDDHEYTSFYSKQGRSASFYLQFLKTITIDACRVLLGDATFQAVASERSNKYDAIVVDPIFSECGLSLVWILNSPPLIYYCPTYLPSWISISLQIPTPFATIPAINKNYTNIMTFAQRFMNTVQNVKLWILRSFILVRGMEDILRDSYPTMPPLLDIEQNVSFVFANSHSQSIDFSRPLTPYFAEVGGAHCRPAARLPKDLEEFVEGSQQHGFIYFALGSYIHSEEMPQERIASFVEVFRNLKQRVLWKFEGHIADLPDNVRLLKWAPQQDILGHPKIKAFLSHGGQLSVQEAVYHGVPILGMPFIADEFSNIKNLVEKGMAEEIDYFTFDAEEVHRKIINLIHDKRFKHNMLHYSALMQDRPMKAVETTVYWIEYIIRHKGAHHLRFSLNHISFFQYFLLDVIGSTLILLIFISLISILAVRQLVQKTIKKSKHNNNISLL